MSDDTFDPLSAFEEFWAAYPKVPNQSKTVTRKSWGKLSQMDQLHAIKGLVGYKAFLASKPDHSVCHAATWLNQKRWEGFVSGEGIVRPPTSALRRPQDFQSYTNVIAWESLALANPMARQAAQEGWLLSLLRFVVEHNGEFPDAAQEAAFKASWRPFLLAVKKSGEDLSSWRSSMMSLARAMLEKGTELSRSIGVEDSAYERALARFHQFASRGQKEEAAL